MGRLSLQVLFYALVLVAFPVVECRAITLFTADNSARSFEDQLVSVDPATGLGTPIGLLGMDGVFSMAFDPATNTLYGLDVATDQVVTIDRVTGAATPLFDLVGAPTVLSLEFDAANDRLLAVETVTDDLISIDLRTGAVSYIGDTGYEIIQGIALQPGTGTMFAVDREVDQLLTLDLATGMGTPVGPVGFELIAGLSFHPGTGVLYGLDAASDQLVTIDLVTGAGTAVGPIGRAVRDPVGLAFVPEPATTLMLGLGLALLAGSRDAHRKETRPRDREGHFVSY